MQGATEHKTLTYAQPDLRSFLPYIIRLSQCAYVCLSLLCTFMQPSPCVSILLLASLLLYTLLLAGSTLELMFVSMPASCLFTRHQDVVWGPEVCWGKAVLL